MARLGFGSIYEQQKAEAALTSFGINSLPEALRRLKEPHELDTAVLEHITTAFGKDADIQAALVKRTN